MRRKKDYYETLGVPRNADEKAIKAAYRRLARQYHPDVNKEPGAEDRFKEISEAFAVLSDSQKRARYDRGGHEAFGPDFDPFAGFGFDFRRQRGAGGGGFGFPDLAEIFEMFGIGAAGGGRPARARRGNDLQLEVRVPFGDAIKGATLDLVIPRQAGPSRIEDRVKVRIPAGIADGERVRLAGRGDSPPDGGRPGDAYLVVRVEPDPRFRREGNDLLTDVAVGLARAALGGEVSVPTLDGSATINLPPGTRSGQKLRLRGKGVPAGKSRPAGDLLAVVQIHPPRKLDARSRELLEEFERLNPAP